MLTAVAAPAFAFAQGSPLVLTGPPDAEHIQQILVNKDGKLTAEEFNVDFKANPPGSPGARA